MSLFPIRAVRAHLGEPLKQYSWEVVIPDPPPLSLVLTYGLSIRARTAYIPGVDNQTFRTHFGPFEFIHPGKKSYPREMLIRFEEGYNWPVLPALRFWHDSIFDESSGRSFSERINTSNIWLRLLGSKPEDPGFQLTQAIHLYNAFPSRIADSTIQYESSEPVFFDVSFAYDYWRWELWPF